MKIKNLLLVPLLSVALVATSACSSSSEGSSSGAPTSEPTTSGEPGQKVVSRITVKARLSSVVGEILDLDTLVDVYYEDGSTSKDYTAEAQLASKDLVKIEGHKVEFLKEGSVNITLKSGGQQAKFSTSVVTKLKKDFQDATDLLGTNFGYLELEVDGSGNLNAYPYTTHNENYTTFAGWDEDADKNEIPGGFLRTQKGRCYTYVLDANYQNIDVDPTPYGAFDNYYVNMPFAFDTANLQTIVEEDDEYLLLDSKAPATYDNFDSFIEEFCYCQLAFLLNDKYAFYSIEIRELALDETKPEDYSFVFSLNVIRMSDAQVLRALDLLLFDDTASYYGVEAVENYIDSGEEPAGVDLSDVTAKFVAMREAKNFTVEISADDRETDTSGKTIPGTEEHVFDEYIYANEKQYEDSIYQHKDSSDMSSEMVLAAREGLVEYAGSLWSYELEGDKNPATELGAGKTVYVDGLAATLVSLMDASTLNLLFASTKEDVAGLDYYRLPIEINADYLKGVLGLTYSGTTILNWVEYALANYQVDLFNDSYAESYFILGADSFQFTFDMFMGSTQVSASVYHYTYRTLTFTFKDVGTTAAIPTVIDYPLA